MRILIHQQNIYGVHYFYSLNSDYSQQLLQKMIVYLLATVLLWIVTLQQNMSCIYNKKATFSLGSNTILSTNVSYWYITLTWDTPQTSIVASSQVLMGLNILSASGGIQFDTGLMNITSTGGKVTLKPYNATQIISMTVTIILVSACSGYIELHQVIATPSILNQVSRGNTSSESMSLNLNSTITDDTSNYLIDAMISSFYLVSAGADVELSVQKITLNSNSSAYSLQYYSSWNLNNSYMQICFTVILVHVSTFNYQLSYYQPLNQRISFYPNLNISNDFNPYISRKCTISLKWLKSQGNSFTIQLIDTGNSSFTNISSMMVVNSIIEQFGALCLQSCNANSYVDYYLQTSTCIPCQNRSQFCQQCTPPSFTCTKCLPSYYLLSSKSTCYARCPAGYYGDSNTSICVTCNPMCITCNDAQSCITCLAGNPVSGICITLQGCTNATINIMTNQAICLSCKTEQNFVLSNNICVCVSGYRLISNLCINVAGCIAASQSDVVVCVACNSMLKLELRNGNCACISGFQLKNGACTQICGDGKLFTLPCDDGNNVNGDGCSSVCKVEKDYQCLNGTSNSRSICTYIGKYIKLSLQTITNSNIENQALFIFKIIPPLYNIQQSELMNASLNSTASLSINSIQYSAGQLSLYVDYSQDIEGYPATFTLNLGSSRFLKSSYQITFLIKSEGMMFSYSSSANASSYQSLKQAYLIISVIVILVFLVSVFVHKMAGIQMMISFQVITLVHSTNNNYTKIYSLFHTFSILSANPLYIIGHQNNIYTIQENIAFSQKHQQFSLNIITGTCLSFICIFGVLNIMNVFYSYTTKLPNNVQNKLEKYIKILYKNLIFPFTLVFFLPFMCILSTYKTQTQSTTTYFIPLQMILTATVFHYQWKGLVTSNQVNDNFAGVVNAKPMYIPSTLTLMLLMALLLSFSFHYTFISTSAVALGFYGLYSIWIIIFRPYQSLQNNVAVFLNCFMVICFLVWTFMRDLYKSLLTQQNQIMAIYVFLGIASLMMLVNIFRVAKDIKNNIIFQKESDFSPIKDEQRQFMEKREQYKQNLLKTGIQQIVGNQHNLQSYYLSNLNSEDKQGSNINDQMKRRLKYDYKSRIISANKKNLNDQLLEL